MTAHVPPDDPANAYLEAGGASYWYLALSGLGVVVALLSVRKWLE